MVFPSEDLNNRLPYAHPDELVYMRNLGSKLKENAFVVMLGAGPGVLAMALLEGATKPIELHIVDHDTCQWAETHITSAGLVKNNTIKYIINDSAVYAAEIDRLVDLLIVDADHSYQAVCADIDSWVYGNHVNENGTIFFHDYLERDGGFNGQEEWVVSDVAWAIKDQLPKSWEIVDKVGISAVCQKGVV